MEPCFPEPTADDERPGLMDETRPAFLRRSTWVRAADLRRFYNVNLSRLPVDIGSRLCRDLRVDSTGSKHFELVVGRFLQELGARSIEYEVPGSEGRRIDWLARFDDGPVSVEACVPIANRVLGDSMKRTQETVAMAVRLAPPGWHVLVTSVPMFGPNERKTELRLALQRLYASVPKAEAPGHITLAQTFPNGELDLTLFRLGDPSQPAEYGGGPAVGYMDDTSSVIRNAVEGKRRQARGAVKPVLLALCTNGFGALEVDKFDVGLLGHTTYRAVSGDLAFDPTGVFGGGSGEPTFAGALAFAELQMRGGPDPILYVHPRYQGRLPAALLKLRRRFPVAHGTGDKPATVSGILDRLDWPTT